MLARVFRYRRKVIEQNLANSFPEKSAAERHQIAQGFYRHLADLIVETIKMPAFSVGELRRRVTFYNEEVVKNYLKAGHSVIIMAAHQCNWEWAPSAAVLNGMPADAIYKPLASQRFEKIVRYIRSAFGAKPVPMHRLLREIAARKNEPRLIALVADQVPDRPEMGYWTNFLHQETPFYPGTERLARSLKHPVFYIEMERVGRGYYIATFRPVAEPPYEQLSPGEIIDRYRDLLEKTIRKNPSDWLWSHKRWKHSRKSFEGMGQTRW